MISKENLQPTLQQTLGFIVAFVLGFLSFGPWTGLAAMLLTYTDQCVHKNPMSLELSIKIWFGVVFACVLVFSLRFLFPGVVMFDELAHIGVSALLGSFFSWAIKEMSTKE